MRRARSAVASMPLIGSSSSSAACAMPSRPVQAARRLASVSGGPWRVTSPMQSASWLRRDAGIQSACLTRAEDGSRCSRAAFDTGDVATWRAAPLQQLRCVRQGPTWSRETPQCERARSAATETKATLNPLAPSTSWRPSPKARPASIWRCPQASSAITPIRRGGWYAAAAPAIGASRRRRSWDLAGTVWSGRAGAAALAYCSAATRRMLDDCAHQASAFCGACLHQVKKGPCPGAPVGTAVVHAKGTKHIVAAGVGIVGIVRLDQRSQREVDERRRCGRGSEPGPRRRTEPRRAGPCPLPDLRA